MNVKAVTFSTSVDVGRCVVGLCEIFRFWSVGGVVVRGETGKEVKRRVPVLEREATCCWSRDTAVIVIGESCTCRIFGGCVGEEIYRVPGEVMAE